MTIEKEVYEKHKNLKLAAQEIGIKWPTLYARLKKQGVTVTGDKSRYGSSRDRLAVLAENEFCRIIPEAKNMNATEWQSKFDILVGKTKIDIKCSLPRKLDAKSDRLSWAFSFKKQILECDLIVCFCMSDEKMTEKILAVPHEFFNNLQTVSVPIKGKSKWHDYNVSELELREFILSL